MPHVVTTPNPEFVMLARRDKSFQAVLNRAALNIPDGIGLILAARLAVMAGEDGYRLAALGRVAARFVAVGQWTFGIRSAEWNSRP